MNRRCSPTLTGAAIAVFALAGCNSDGSMDTEAARTLIDDPVSAEYAPLDALGEDGSSKGDDVDGDVWLPDHIEVYVGEELGIEVRPDVPGTLLRPSSLPEGSSFDAAEDGGFFSWRPSPGDIGTHDVVFLEFDSNGLQLRQRTIIVDVLPRFDLIEYGF